MLAFISSPMTTESNNLPPSRRATVSGSQLTATTQGGHCAEDIPTPITAVLPPRLGAKMPPMGVGKSETTGLRTRCARLSSDQGWSVMVSSELFKDISSLHTTL